MSELATTLAATAAAQLALEAYEPVLEARFAPAIRALDDADAAYREAIAATLPSSEARLMLAATTAFREHVQAIRERTRRQLADLYQRGGGSYGWFDPLDAFLPPTTGLSHAEGTRAATLADGARSEVDTLRAQANGSLMERLTPAQIESLVAAKRRRREAFERALRSSLAALSGLDPRLSQVDLDKVRTRLVQLAEGWY